MHVFVLTNTNHFPGSGDGGEHAGDPADEAGDGGDGSAEQSPGGVVEADARDYAGTDAGDDGEFHAHYILAVVFVSIPNLASQKQYAESVPRKRFKRSGCARARSDDDSFTEHSGKFS